MSHSCKVKSGWLIAAAIVSACGTASSADVKSAADTVVVTARYWEEPEDKVPASTDVIDGDRLDGEVTGLDRYISNIRIEESSVQTRVAIRGSTGYDTGLQDPVGYYVDGVALPLGGTQLPQLFNLEQIELIKGPQGTLYGRSSEAGVIKLESQRPDWEPAVSLEVQTGVTDGANGKEPSHVVSLRGSDELIADQLAGSVALRYEDTQGPFVNLADKDDHSGSVKNWSLSSGLDAQISDVTDVRFRSLLSEEDSGKSRLRYSTGTNATDRFTTNYNSQIFDDTQSAIHSLTIDHQMENFDVVSVTGLTNFRRDFRNDLDLTTFAIPETLLDLDDDMLSQEVRLESDRDEDLRWLAGVYLYKQKTDVDFTIGGSLALARSTRETEIDQHGLAGFGQVEYALSQDWSLTLGTRVERISKDGRQNYITTAGNSSYSADVSETMVLPKATLAYQVSDSGMIYASVAKGYLPGGFNYGSAQSASSFTYDSESSVNSEIGYKDRYLNSRLGFSAAVFHIKTRDKQIVDLQPGFVQSIANAAETTSYGVELGADYAITPALSVYGHAGLMRTEADKFDTTVFSGGSFVPVSRAGNDLPLAPEFTYGAGVRYVASQGLFGDLSVNGSGDYYFDSANTLKQSGYSRFDGELGYQFDGFSVSLVAENIFDEEIISRAVSTSSGTVVEDTAPRYIGIKLAANW
ncbi:TonB-dependent receptor [Aliamphritea hakodatensis]|uniref:TonB-dependent receptor n=1 Tax=Aliamphritea hakodatensis TaxID=2895352 RepID=UPI0022FD3A56|nr:TonB-dependent receptor [Aliamphritea hakodatensis]